MTKRTKTSKLIEAFTTGKKLSNQQIHRRFKIANPTAHINYVRNLGHNIIIVDRNKYALAA